MAGFVGFLFVCLFLRTPTYLKQFSSLMLSASSGLGPLQWRRQNPHQETDEKLLTAFSALLEIILKSSEYIFSPPRVAGN